MFRTDAIYQNGVFKPLEPIALPENQRVSLEIVSSEPQEGDAWLEETSRLRKALAAKYGTFPDSTLDIAADRVR